MRAVVLAIVLCIARIASAQRTGGHMGGGDWGGSSPSTGSSPSYHTSPSWSSGGGWSGNHSSNHDSSWSSSKSTHSSFDWDSPSKPSSSSNYDYDYGNRGPLIEPGHFWLGFGVVATLAVLGIIFIGSFKRRGDFSYLDAYTGPIDFGPRPAYPGGVDVTVLRVAVDGRARKFIQKELAQIAQDADTSTEEGRAVMLREVSLLLRRVRDAWVYGGAHNEPMGPLGKAKQVYDRHVDDARTAFEQETITNVQGQRSRTALDDQSRRSDEGEGVILVTIVIAARNELFTVTQIGDGDDLRKALDAASYLTAQDVVAVDVVWMPSEENDRMSSMELEARYPRPELIPIRGALIGKTFCAYCSGPYPAELVSCPHCGAPAAGRAA